MGDLLDDVARLSTGSHSAEETASSALGDEDEVQPATTSSLNAANQPLATNTGETGVVSSDEGLDDTFRKHFEQQLTSARLRFHTVLSELFAERVNWGRVVAMLAFIRALCVFVESRRTIESMTNSSLASARSVVRQTEVSSFPRFESRVLSPSSFLPWRCASIQFHFDFHLDEVDFF